MACIENLSNELFYDIFDYLDGYDILNAFSNLNIRLKNLLDYSSLLLKIKISSKSTLQIRCKLFIIPNRSRIISLNFADESILDRFIVHCTINSSFQRLQSINLNSLPAYKCVVLLFDLISLPRLSSLTCSLTSCFLDVSYIYRIIFRFQYLNYFKLSLPIIEDLEDFEQVIFVAEKQQLSQIEYLIIDHCCTLNDFLSIISFTPRLRRLTCQTLFETNENIGRDDILLTLTNLTHVTIEKCELKFDVLEIFIKKICSQLRVFRIVIRLKDVSYLDADRWEGLITQYMPHLERFEFKYYEYFTDRLKFTPCHRLLDRFLSPFWIERKWILGLEFDANDLIYSIQSRRWHDNSENIRWSPEPTTELDIKYRCSAAWAESFNEYFRSIFSLLKITYLDIASNRVPLLSCIKLIGLLSELKSLKLSSLSLTEAKRLSAEKWKTIHAVAYHNKITRVILDKMADFGEIQFLTTLCPYVEYIQTSSANEKDLELFVQFILTKQNNNHINRLSTLCLYIQNGTNQMVENLQQIIELKRLLHNYIIKRIGNQIYLHWDNPVSDESSG
jgi:hypothetical protein